MSDEPDALKRPIEPGLVARIARGVRYIVGGESAADWFGPDEPPPPSAPPSVAGRSFDFPVGFNLRTTPRGDERLGFHELRALADNYDLLRLVVETRKDQISRLDWSIRKRVERDEMKPGDADDPRVAEFEAFLRYPDREHDFGTWLRLLLEDLLVIDAPTLYLRRNAAGGLFALEVVDGATIKRVIDARGRTPPPPDPAYQQVLKGLPAIDYTTDELIYRPRNPRPHKIYGYSPVEQVVLTVNVALRRQLAQLQYYTEGNVPEAMIGVPESWSPTQIRDFQQYWKTIPSCARRRGSARRLEAAAAAALRFDDAADTTHTRRNSASGSARHKLLFIRLLRGNPRPHQVARDASFSR
jgi:PAS domain-containing protein